MLTTSLFILTGLWVYSVFTFARWRLAILHKKLIFVPVSKDIVLQAYLKVSGSVLMGFLFYILTTRG